MTSPTLKFALAGSWRGSSKAVFSAVVQTLGVATVAFTVLGAVGAVSAERHAHERRVETAFLPANDRADATALTYPMIDEAPGVGETITVTVLKRTSADTRVPGIPDGGRGWFVSPALAQLIEAEPGLRARYPKASELGVDGVGFANDLRAVRIVDSAEGLELPITDTVNRAVPHLIDQRGLTVGLLTLIGIPCLAGLLGATTAVARGLRPRVALLRKLGASTAQIASRCASVATLTAIPGCAVGSVAWWWLSPSLTTLPLIGMPVFAGDVELAPPVYASVCAALIALVSAITVARAVFATADGVIGDQRPPEPRSARWYPMCAALALMTLAPVLPRTTLLFFTGLVALVVGLLVAFPRMLWLAGDAIARTGRRRPQALLAGRVLQAEARFAGGAYLPIATIAVLVPFVTIWVASAQDPPREQEPPYWYRMPTDVDDSEIHALADELDLTVMRLTASSSSTNGPLDRVHVVGDCTALPTLNGTQPCAADATVLTPAGPATMGPPITPAPEHPIDEMFVVAATLETGNQLRAHFLNRTPPVGVPHLGLLQPRSPLEPWLIGGLEAAVALTLVGLALYAIGVGRTSTVAQARLDLLGADARQVRFAALRLELIVGACALAVGVMSATAVQMLFSRFDPGASVQVGVLAMTAAIGGFATATVAALAASGRHDPVSLWSETSALNSI